MNWNTRLQYDCNRAEPTGYINLTIIHAYARQGYETVKRISRRTYHLRLA